MALLASRNIDILLNRVRHVRISKFYSPSSFHVQLLVEDVEYNTLELEMLDYCGSQNFAVLLGTYTPLVRLKVADLKSGTLVAVEINGRWVRCKVLDAASLRCRCIDDGDCVTLTYVNILNGLYEIVEHLAVLPPRAVLCGLAFISPTTVSQKFWSFRAAEIFQQVTTNRTLNAYFVQLGECDDSVHVVISSSGSHKSVIHVNTLLIAFNVAVQVMGDIHFRIRVDDELEFE
ncbi:hypothetical protein QAD02_002187 [Eretmocerus hayati]|uniref:Uncharacterized protein n=1 Tax=Eretmocerus hayati TaxID=131215 RepID=A0ACC2NID3_9HYME|nr:hypothetical protein QAD02_002187 [Eretmocerus hayati]